MHRPSEKSCLLRILGSGIALVLSLIMAITSSPPLPPAYCVWVAELADPPRSGLTWQLHVRHGDPIDPGAARRAAHADAAALRRKSPALHVAVRPAGTCPPPIGSQAVRG